jgi:hypothetical protein
VVDTDSGITRAYKKPRPPDFSALVLASQANHQSLDFWTGAWPARRAALLGAIEYLSHQLAIPGENSIGFGEPRNLLQSFAT